MLLNTFPAARCPPQPNPSDTKRCFRWAHAPVTGDRYKTYPRLYFSCCTGRCVASSTSILPPTARCELRVVASVRDTGARERSATPVRRKCHAVAVSTRRHPCNPYRVGTCSLQTGDWQSRRVRTCRTSCGTPRRPSRQARFQRPRRPRRRRRQPAAGGEQTLRTPNVGRRCSLLAFSASYLQRHVSNGHRWDSRLE